MSNGNRVGDNVTKTTYVETDGHHAFYAKDQTYVGIDGESMLETVTSEKLHWVTHDDGRTTLDACYDGTWLRSSNDNGTSWCDVGSTYAFDTSRAEEQMLPSGIILDENTGNLIRFFRGQKADKTCYSYVNQGAYREFYSVSKDGGDTWTDPVQIIDGSGEFNENTWGPNLEYGARGAMLNGGHCLWMEDAACWPPSPPTIAWNLESPGTSLTSAPKAPGTKIEPPSIGPSEAHSK